MNLKTLSGRWNTNAQPSLSVAQSAENLFTIRSEKKRRNLPSRKRRSAKRLAEFLDKKRQLATDNFDPSCSGDSATAACGSLAKPDPSLARGSGRKPILRFVPAAGILQSNQITTY